MQTPLLSWGHICYLCLYACGTQHIVKLTSGGACLQTEDSLAALFEALKSMYPGFKHKPLFMAIDEVDEASLGDTHRMAKGKITICQKIVALRSQHQVVAIAQVTATPYGPKLINREKFEQAHLQAMVPQKLWQQELASNNSYAGPQTYFSPKQDAANNIVLSEDCPGYVISKEVSNFS